MFISSVQVNVQVVLVKYLGLCYDLSLTFDTRLFLKMSNIDICLFADNSTKFASTFFMFLATTAKYSCQLRNNFQ